MNGGAVKNGKASNAGGLVFGDTGSELTFAGGTVNCNITDSTTKCVYAKGTAVLTGSADVSQIRLTKVASKSIIIRGKYTGSAQVTYTAATNDQLMNGDVIGISENADLTSAKVTIYKRACYVVADGDELKISFAKPANRKTGFCD